MKRTRKLWLANSLVFLVVLVAGIFIFERATHRNDTWNRVQQRQTLKIGIDDTFVPMGFRNKQGQLIGYDVELARAACKKLGVRPEFQVIDWSMKETELATGHIDAIWNGYTITPERREHAAFTNIYHKSYQVLLTRKNAGVNQPQDLHDKQLGVQSGSSGYTMFQTKPQALKQYLKTKPVQYDTFDKAINDVRVGRLAAVLIDRDYANYYLNHETGVHNLKIVATSFPPDEYAVGVRKQDRTLRLKLNQAIQQLHRDGTEQRLARKYFGKTTAKQ